jgi:hypothetical protein
MVASSLIRRHPDVEVLHLELDMTKEEAVQRVEPYWGWWLLELDIVHDEVLIYTPLGNDNKRLLILSGYAARLWFLNRLPG